MEPLPRIPSPPAHQWREFRIRAMPVIIFFAMAIIAVVIWKDHIAAPTVFGEVETLQANVSSAKAGLLTKLNVERFQPVSAGDIIGELQIGDPSVLAARVAVIRAEIESVRASLKPILGLRQASLNELELRLEGMRQRVQLMTAKVNLDYNTSELDRMLILKNENVISARVLEKAQAAKNKLETEVEELDKLVKKSDDLIDRLHNQLTNEVVGSQGPADPMQAAIAVQEEKLRLTEAEMSPIILKAPTSGIVSIINKRAGEAVTPGEPIITISQVRAEHIVGYMRQPISLQPKVGMNVQVRTRGFNRQIATATILQVGSEMEVDTSPLRVRGLAKNEERGLPFLVSLPSGMKVHPGELVDLILQPGQKPAHGQVEGSPP